MEPFDDYKYKRVAKKDGLSALFIGTAHNVKKLLKENELVKGPKKLGKKIDLVVVEAKCSNPVLSAFVGNEFEKVSKNYPNVYYLEKVEVNNKVFKEKCRQAAKEAEPDNDKKANLIYECSLASITIAYLYASKNDKKRPLKEVAAALCSKRYTLISGSVGVSYDYSEIGKCLDRFYGKREGGKSNNFLGALAEDCNEGVGLVSKILAQEPSLDELFSEATGGGGSRFLSNGANDVFKKFSSKFNPWLFEEREEDWLKYFDRIKPKKRILCYTGLAHTKSFVDRLIEKRDWEEKSLDEW